MSNSHATLQNVLLQSCLQPRPGRREQTVTCAANGQRSHVAHPSLPPCHMQSAGMPSALHPSVRHPRVCILDGAVHISGRVTVRMRRLRSNFALALASSTGQGSRALITPAAGVVRSRSWPTTSMSTSAAPLTSPPSCATTRTQASPFSWTRVTCTRIHESSRVSYEQLDA